jgi:hypothetical protein
MGVRDSRLRSNQKLYATTSLAFLTLIQSYFRWLTNCWNKIARNHDQDAMERIEASTQKHFRSDEHRLTCIDDMSRLCAHFGKVVQVSHHSHHASVGLPGQAVGCLRSEGFQEHHTTVWRHNAGPHPPSSNTFLVIGQNLEFMANFARYGNRFLLCSFPAPMLS